MAMKRKQVESALDGVDAQMLELLSDQFLYPNSKPSISSSRPRGRPDFVPGAMKQDTMIRFRQNKEMMGRAMNQRVSALDDTLQSENVLTKDTAESTEVSPRKRGKVKGLDAKSGGDQLPGVAAETKKRKRVVKNLPERKDRSQASPKGRKSLNRSAKANANNLELQKYYRTELLSPTEEYSLGVKIQLMVNCELVHEGLAIEYMRLPTIEEWANACG
jgi:hypothetical protein